MAWVDVLIREELDRGGASSESSPVFASAAEIDELLAPPQTAARIIAGTVNNEHAPASSTAARLRSGLRDRERQTLEEGRSLRVLELAQAFDLSETAVDILLVALAAELDGKYGRIFGYLHDDLTAMRPTVEVILRLLAGHEHDRLALRSAFAPGAPLQRHHLLQIESDRPGPRRPVRVDDRIVGFLLGGDAWALDPDIAMTLHEPCSVTDDPLPPNASGSLAPIAAAVTPNTTPPVMGVFSGEDERAAETAVAAVCAGADRSRLQVDGLDLTVDGLAGSLKPVIREARLHHAIVHVTSAGDPNEDPDRFRQLLTVLDGVPDACFLTSATSIPATVGASLDRHVIRTRHFPRPSMDDRITYWSAAPDIPADVSAADLASRYRLTSGEILDAIETARILGDGTITHDGIEAGCRLQSRGGLGEHAREIDPGYEWSDIVLPPAVCRQLHELAAMMQQRGRIFEQWGFEDRFTRGTGINALFTGKPGTGKTMAAEVIAADVGLPLYRLDLSSVLSKYIGETEENLGRVFDALERSDAIVFFDEADALFGSRTEISDSRDRYANAEVDYLLERMEDHDGCVILASNLKENIDEAFRRRITAHIEFPRPDESARREIWSGIFPADTPTTDLDLAYLAEFELTGGDIKNVAIYAAGLAANADEPIGMKQLVRAIDRQLQQAGALFDRSIFGDYQELLE